MGWVLLALAAVIAGAMAAGAMAAGAMTIRRIRRAPAAVVYRHRSRAERREPPHRHAVHYRASGALPRWDP